MRKRKRNTDSFLRFSSLVIMASLHSPICLILMLSYFFLVAVVVDAQEANDSIPTPINRDLYHSSADLLDQVEALAHRHPDKLTVEVVKADNKGYHAEITVVTYRRNRKESDAKSKIRILLSFGQHGRELITSELALRILSILSEEQFLPKVGPNFLNATLNQLLIKLVPMENLNGRKVVEEGDFCDSRNGRGVDLNRNWSVDWGKKEKDYDPYEENPGTAPFSEPETQIMRKLALTFDPHIWVNVHSGMEALFMPYDHKNTTPGGAHAQLMRSLLGELNQAHCHRRCMIGSGGGSVGYLAHGTATDYMYDIVKVPMAFTFEIYGDPKASSKDCFRMFNPVDHSTFDRVLNDWSAAFSTIFSLAPQILESRSKPSINIPDKWVSIDDYLDGYLMERKNRYGKKLEVLDLGMQEIRTYFRLFLLSSVLLLFMFCSRISKSSRPIISSIPL